MNVYSEAIAPVVPDLKELRKACRRLTDASGAAAIKDTCSSLEVATTLRPATEFITGSFPIQRPVTIGSGLDIQTLATGADALLFAVSGLITECSRAKDIILATYCSQYVRDRRLSFPTTPLPQSCLFAGGGNVLQLPGQYDDRLEELREAAGYEGLALNEKSLDDFRDFISTAPVAMKRPNLALIDDGDIRASWRAGDRRLAVQFFGNGTVEYVLLDEPPIIGQGAVVGFWSDHDIESLITA